ncbi:MAG: DUF2807 domain-containing protein [Muribaculaceae bacterium]|nr:DUF2807 domain-containing protein [Muribaculaceae bacterium]
MKKVLTVVLFALIACITLHAEDYQNYEVKIGDFTNLRITDHINVIYSTNPDSIGYAQFSCSPKLADAVIFTNNKKGRLTIQISTDAVDNPKLPTVFVYSNFLQDVNNEADSTVRIAEMTSVPKIRFRTTANGKIIAPTVKATSIEASVATGKGIIIVGGKCTDASLKLTGTGEIQADKLECTNAECRLLGTGSIGCNVADRLVIRGSGTGKVYYVGTPKEIKTYQLGSIKAIPLDPK